MPKSSFLEPAKVIESLKLSPGEVVIDFGCGSGHWAIPMAQKVIPGGKVYAIDEYDANLELVKTDSQKKGLTNIICKKAPYSAGKIPVSEDADLILISNILSEISNDNELIHSAKKNAKSGTKLVIIDWSKNNLLEVGPRQEERSTEEEIIISARKAGFEFKRLLESGTHHFGLFFEYQGK